MAAKPGRVQKTSNPATGPKRKVFRKHSSFFEDLMDYLTGKNKTEPVEVEDPLGESSGGHRIHPNGVDISHAAHAEGQTPPVSTASGGYSYAEGSQSTASGNYSHAEGYLSYAMNNSDIYDQMALENLKEAMSPAPPISKKAEELGEQIMRKGRHYPVLPPKRGINWESEDLKPEDDA